MSHHDSHPPLEVELKLLFPEEARAALDAHPALLADACDIEEERQVTTYYDSPELALAKSGYSLRIRHRKDRRIQTVKSGADGHGVAGRRGEWEWPIDRDEPDLALVAQTPAGEVLGPDAREKLGPIFTTDIRRVTRRLRLDDGAVVEVAVDEGQLRADDREQPIRELELELKDGPVGPLYRLALALFADLPLRIGVESKAARGYRMLTGQPPEAARARDPALERDMLAAEGFRRIVATALGGLLANQAAAAFCDAEGIHQMRIAIRRLRAALVLFRPHLQPRPPERFNAELRRLGRILGEARDWDVFCLETMPAAFRKETEENLQPLLEGPAQAEREASHQRLREEFARPELTGLALAMAAWTEDKPELLGDDALRQRLGEIAPDLLDRVARKAFKRGRNIHELSQEELHGVRKSLKKLRYSIDYMAGVYPRKAVKAYLKRCKDLQELLGEINDAVVAAALAERLDQNGHPERIPAVAALAHWAERRRSKAIRRLPETWHKFACMPPFWQ